MGKDSTSAWLRVPCEYAAALSAGAKLPCQCRRFCWSPGGCFHGILFRRSLPSSRSQAYSNTSSLVTTPTIRSCIPVSNSAVSRSMQQVSMQQVAPGEVVHQQAGPHLLTECTLDVAARVKRTRRGLPMFARVPPGLSQPPFCELATSLSLLVSLALTFPCQHPGHRAKRNLPRAFDCAAPSDRTCDPIPRPALGFSLFRSREKKHNQPTAFL